jgi:iron complex outermembrane receptor protein
VIGQGLASTIDLRTVQPLDFGKRVLPVSVTSAPACVPARQKATASATPSAMWTNSLTAPSVWRGCHQLQRKRRRPAEIRRRRHRHHTYNGQSVVVPAGFKADTETSKNNRDGVSAMLQYRPNKDFKTSVDLFYSAGSTSLKKTGLEGSIGGSWGGYDPVGTLSNATIQNGVATSAPSATSRVTYVTTKNRPTTN